MMNGNFLVPTTTAVLLLLLFDIVTATIYCTIGDDDQSCSYNGVCRCASKVSLPHCHCDPGWTGRFCESLDLMPVHNASGLQDLLTNQNISTWGGSVQFDASDQLYHMWFSEIIHHCGIHRWVSNSVVSHATSRGPDDHWKFHKTDTIFHVFTHEPIVARDPSTDEYVLFVSHYPNGSAADSPICVCQDGTTESTTNPMCHGEAPLGKHKSMDSFFARASTAHGPWSDLQSLKSVTPREQRRVDQNLAPMIFPNHSLVAWTRWDIWTATDWRNVSTYRVDGQAPDFTNPNGNWEGEDPSMWMDRKGRFHILSHNGDRGRGGTSQDPKGDCGRHLFSATGRAGTWITAPLPLGGCAYPRVNVSFVNGINRSFYRRERPHLILGPDGYSPIALSTSVIDSPISPESPQFQPPARDASYTLIQAIRETPSSLGPEYG